MEKIKLQNFEKDYPDRNFPVYETLSAIASEQIKRKVYLQMHLPETTAPLDLLTSLKERAAVVENVNCESDDFDLGSEISRLGIVPEEKVFINWNRFDRIDVIKLEDLIANFDYIWYPTLDDIDIFDNSLKWILSVGYSGDLTFIKFT